MNVNFITEEIKKLNGPKPYFFNPINNKEVITDYDNFPYNRWYRGSYKIDVPIIAEREAGWRVINNECYKDPINHGIPLKPKNIFQAACTTIFPKKNNRQDLDDDFIMKNNCVVEYR